MYYEAIISFTKDQQQVGSNMPGAAVTRFLVQADSLAEAEAHVDGIGDRFGLDGDRAFNSMDLPPDVAAAEGRFMTKERVHQEQATRYWFEIGGEDFAIVEALDGTGVVDFEGYPVEHPGQAADIMAACPITDDMRA